MKQGTKSDNGQREMDIKKQDLEQGTQSKEREDEEENWGRWI